MTNKMGIEVPDETDMDGAIGKLLSRDPLAEMEDQFGLDHYSQANQGQQMAMLGHAMALNAEKQAVLQAANDSHFGTTLGEYLQILSDEGFSLTLKEPFTCEGRSDSLYAFWHPDGVFLVLDSYHGRLNGGNFYYNWRPKNPDEWRTCGGVLSSGGWRSESKKAPNSDWIWAGYHDCREAIRLRLRELRRVGSFVCPWQYDPYLNIWHYGDRRTTGKDIDQRLRALRESTSRRIAMLPEHVRKAITPTGE